MRYRDKAVVIDEAYWVKHSTKQVTKAFDANEALLERIDLQAAAKGELLWRCIREGRGDGYACYQIVKVGKRNVRIEVCRNIGDDWVIPYWGEATTISRKYAERKVDSYDAMKQLFGRKAG